MADVTRAEIPRIGRHESWTRGGAVVASYMADDQIEALAEQSAASVADPTPLGLWALATASWIFGTIAIGVFSGTDFAAVAPILLVFGGVAQFIAGLFAFRRADALMGTALCAFGSLYTTLAVFFGLQLGGVLPAAGGHVVLEGFLLESFAFMALGLMLGAFRTNFVEVATFGLLGIGYALVGIPSLANAVGQGGWNIVSIIGGCFLLASALMAYYGGLALVVNSTWKRTALPLIGTV